MKIPYIERQNNLFGIRGRFLNLTTFANRIIRENRHATEQIAPCRAWHITNSYYPPIAYDVGFTGRSRFDDAFAAASIDTNIVLTAMNSDVSERYMSLGMGVGIVASMAIERKRAASLHWLDMAYHMAHLFASIVTCLAVRCGAYLRTGIHECIRRFAPDLKRPNVINALNLVGQ